ncbi:MAG: ABC-F family ATP-binding cassette domain-containing protein [Kiritimatiellia bacterium]|jgi:ATP-binding cassette subfamily F protein 3
MISFNDVSIHFGAQDVLNNVSFKINPRERCGIVGPNGAGKSTLFNLIAGEISPESGAVAFDGPRPTLGHLHQQLDRWDATDTLLSYAMRASADIRALEGEIHAIEREILELDVDSRERAQALDRLGDLQTEYEHCGGYDLEIRVKEALGGLGFHTTDFERPFQEFSGGWKMRAELVRTLVANPDVLMLDEPSNYLDLPAVEWMQRHLREFDGTLLIISHDRYLLRTLTNVTLEVDGQTVTRYNGGYDYYLQERVQRYESLVAAKRNQDRLRDQMQRFIDTFRYTPTKAPQVQSRIKQIEKMEPIIVPRQATTSGRIRLPEFHHCGTTAFSMRDAGFSYNGADWVFRNVSFEIARGEHVALVGFNGMGKTTLARLVAGARPPTEGEVLLGHKVVPGYVSQDFAETIPPERSLINVVKNEDATLADARARTLLGSFGFSGDDAFKTAGILSGGEKIRLAFARIFAAKPNFLVLDEPTTHLDINGRRALEEELAAYEGSIVLVSHDVEFVKAIAETIIEVSDAGVRRFVGGYVDYRERIDQEAAAARRQANADTAPESASAPATDADDAPDASRPTLSKKDLRRQRAAEQEQRRPLLRSLTRRVAAAEARIAQLEAEQAELVASLADPGAKPDFENVNRRLGQIQDEFATVNALWEQAASELAYLEAE